jgi:hypothetical protein
MVKPGGRADDTLNTIIQAVSPPRLMRTPIAQERWTRAWPLVVALLLLLRVPSLAQPMGGDQGLYAYVGQRVLDGGVPYRDGWDQKPPAIFFVYAALWRVWPHESVVAAADLAAAALIGVLLVLIGRRLFGVGTGAVAAAVFLLWSDPTLAGLSGVYIRSQCETFIALAVTAALWCAIGSAGPAAGSAGLKPGGYDSTTAFRLVLAGVWLALAAWLKYNAIVYTLPVLAALWWRAGSDRRRFGRDLALVALGLAGVTLVILAYFSGHGALRDLRLATIDYNLRYSQETYAGPIAVLRYLVTFPLERARVEMLWFLGGLGVVGLVASRLGAATPTDQEKRATDTGSSRLSYPSYLSHPSYLLLLWLAAAVFSIAINGARDLPQYFVQAAPPLALTCAAGLAGLHARWPWGRYAIIAAILAGLWRVGADAPGALGWRWGGVPDAVERVGFDLAGLTGRIDRGSYLARFRGRKYDAAAIDDLARYAAETTTPTERLFVFGFTGGAVNAKAHRVSGSRFFWSRPVIIEFAAGQPGYGSAGLLADLEAHPPVLVALQKHDWHSTVDPIPDSAAFFLSRASLRAWLEAGYVPDRDTDTFVVWRRKP